MANRTLSTMPDTWHELSRRKHNETIAPNTRVCHVGETTLVYFYETPIYCYGDRGLVERFNLGDHVTVSTTRRINRLLPPRFRVAIVPDGAALVVSYLDGSTTRHRIPTNEPVDPYSYV